MRRAWPSRAYVQLSRYRGHEWEGVGDRDGRDRAPRRRSSRRPLHIAASRRLEERFVVDGHEIETESLRDAVAAVQTTVESLMAEHRSTDCRHSLNARRRRHLNSSAGRTLRLLSSKSASVAASTPPTSSHQSRPQLLPSTSTIRLSSATHWNQSLARRRASQNQRCRWCAAASRTSPRVSSVRSANPSARH